MNPNDQYEMVPTQEEWSRNDHNNSLPPQTEIRPNGQNQNNLKSYTWSSLDADWYPILANKLTPHPGPIFLYN